MNEEFRKLDRISDDVDEIKIKVTTLETVTKELAIHRLV